MRLTSVAALLVAGALSQGCAADCGPAAQISANTYEVFTHPLNATGENLNALRAGPAFASYSIPVNGESSWVFKFGDAEVGPMKVIIDGQSFNAQGIWDPIECGNFVISGLKGLYVSTDGTQHSFSAVMNMVVFGDQIEGLVQWNENWELIDGTGGSYRSTAQMRGLLGTSGGAAQ